MPQYAAFRVESPLPSPAGMRGELRRKASPGLGVAHVVRSTAATLTLSIAKQSPRSGVRAYILTRRREPRSVSSCQRGDHKGGDGQIISPFLNKVFAARYRRDMQRRFDLGQTPSVPSQPSAGLIFLPGRKGRRGSTCTILEAWASPFAGRVRAVFVNPGASNQMASRDKPSDETPSSEESGQWSVVSDRWSEVDAVGG
jgi:hypothetical protein